MHLVTAAVLSLIANRKIGKLSFPKIRRRTVPSFRGIIEHVHGIPGRHRYRIPSLIGNDSGADTLKDHLTIVPEVDSVSCDLRAGSLLVKGSEEMDPGFVLAAAARLLDLEKEIEQTPVSKFSTGAVNIWSGIDRALYEKTGGRLTADDAVGLALLGLALNEIRRTRTIGIPPAFTLIWWFFTLSKKKGGRW